MIFGFRERELILDIFEMITGLRMNHAYIRPGGVVPGPAARRGREDPRVRRPRAQGAQGVRQAAHRAADLATTGFKDVGYLDLTGCLALGITGPMLRATGLPWDLRKSEPYCGYETYDFDVPTHTDGDCWARFLVRMDEMRESLKIVEQASTGSRPARSWSRTRRSPGRRSSRSAPTAWATRSTTSGTSWAPRWRR